ncbi:MAG: response regulator [Bacteroidetes bacterium]|nr:response regulator [Bacteroidota bacterium]MBU1578786.1 response regulator [Bacteroidota bacterium]MBU2466478.1 response regulator [Bacteroidota bacterium]MBU2557005.1 response regulator [Bacteroidota bacterium]
MRKTQPSCLSLLPLMLLISLAACKQLAEPLPLSTSTSTDSIYAPVAVYHDNPVVGLLSDHPKPEQVDLSRKPLPQKQRADFYISMENFNTDQGLALSSILCGFKDHAGKLWFGTFGNGVSKFDGKTFTNFSSAHGLPHNLINSITEDRQGNIWFSTFGGLSKYDGVSFKNFTTADGLPDNDVLQSLEDRQGTLWAATAKGLCRSVSLDKSTSPEKFILIHEEHGFIGNYTRAIIEDQKGSIWVITDRGIMKYDPWAEPAGKITFTDYSKQCGLEGLFINCIAEDGDGMIWFGTDEGVFRFDPEKADTENAATVNFTMTDGLVSDKITSIVEDSEGTLWFGSKAGVSSLKKDEAFFLNFTSNQGLANNSIICITEDASGSIWFGTSGGGLSRLDGLSTLEYKQQQGLLRKAVFSIAEDSAGNMWFGVQDGGITKLERDTLNPNNDSFIQFSTTQGLTSHNVLTMLFDKNGHLWYGSGNGLNHYNEKSITTYKTDQGMVNNNVVSLMEDSRGNVWLGTYEKGLNRFDGHSFVQYTTAQGLVHNTVWDMHEDETGTVWLATRGGLSRYDGKRFINFTKAQGLPDNKLSIVTQDRFGNLLIGSWGGGVSIIRKSKLEALKKTNFTEADRDLFQNFNTTNGLANDVVYGILEDEAGNILIGTSKGLTVLKGGLAAEGKKIASAGIEYYNQKTGYPIKDISNNYSMHIDSHGFVWLGTGDKLVRFDYKEVRKSSSALFPEIQEIRINNEKISWQSLKRARSTTESSLASSANVPAYVLDELLVFGRTLSNSERDTMSFKFSAIHFDDVKPFSAIPENLVLPFSFNTISFDFVAVETSRPFLVRYQYFLEGYDEQWNVATEKSTVDYRNLPQGNYTFKVKAKSPDGIWSEPISYRFRVLPPWWLTWWAFLLYVLAFLLIISGIRRYELNRIRLRNQLKLEKVTTDSLRNLDQMKSQFYANISHEFRTPLTLILGQIENVMSSAIDSKEKGKLQVANRNARRLLKLINELLDLSKLEAGGMELYAENNNMVSFLKNLFFSFESMAAQKKIRLSFESEADDITVLFDTDKMEKVFYNLLSNAFKFTPENGAIKIGIGIANAHLIEIKVQDTGCGIPKDKLENIFDRFYQVDDSNTREHEGTGIGLALAKELVLLHKGKIRVNSKLNAGTQFIVTLPYAYTGQNKSPVSETRSQEINSEGLDDGLHTKNSLDKPIEPTQQLEGAKKIVLIVEDNKDVRAYIREQIEGEYHAFEAIEGEQGLSLAQEIVPDLIITDVMMPKMDGYQFCNAIRLNEKTSHIPIIMLTARGGLEDKIEGLDAGVDAYLTKPFSAKELMATVKNLLHQRMQLKKRFSKSLNIKPSEVSVVSADQVFLEKVIQTIASNFGDEQFSVELLAEHVNMSVTQLNRKLNALIDQPPGQMIRSFRLQRAADLLKQKAGSVSEISYQVGFNDNAYFSRAFKKQFGCSPSEFHDQIKGT